MAGAERDEGAQWMQTFLEHHGARDPGETFRAPSMTWGEGDFSNASAPIAVPPAPVAPHPTLPTLTLGSGDPVAGDPSGPDLRLKEELGRGGMGVVNLAWQASLERDVAIKQVRRDASVGLLREARIMGALEHPNIIPVHALGLDRDGRPVMVMKRVSGVVLHELLADPTHGHWDKILAADPLSRKVRVLMEVCQALHFAHARGVLHRDVKPDNVMVCNFGEVYLLDWGVAAHLGEGGQLTTGAVVGTPAYMAPEMARAGGDG